MFVFGPVIFLEKGTKVHPMLRGNKLVTRYVFSEGYFFIPNKLAYIDDGTWDNFEKLVSPGIRKVKVSSGACVLSALFSIYLTLHICPSKLSADDI